MKNIKKKLFLQKSFNFNNEEKDNVGIIEGLGLVYSTPDSVGDTFDKNLKINFGYENRPVDLLYNHNHTDILASTRNNTLSFERTDVGLKFRSILQKTDSIYNKVKSGLVDGTSFGFLINDYEENEYGGYNFTDISVYELSLTWEPAHVGTSVKTKNLSSKEVEESGEFVSSVMTIEKSLSKEKDLENEKEEEVVLDEDNDSEDSQEKALEEEKQKKNKAKSLTIEEELALI